MFMLCGEWTRADVRHPTYRTSLIPNNIDAKPSGVSRLTLLSKQQALRCGGLTAASLFCQGEPASLVLLLSRRWLDWIIGAWAGICNACSDRLACSAYVRGGTTPHATGRWPAQLLLLRVVAVAPALDNFQQKFWDGTHSSPGNPPRPRWEALLAHLGWCRTFETLRRVLCCAVLKATTM